LTQTIIVGGTIDSETAEVAVNPVRSSPIPAVMTQTPPAIWRIASLSVGAPICTGCFTAAFIINLSGRLLAIAAGQASAYGVETEHR
jgi:hypothetical protein